MSEEPSTRPSIASVDGRLNLLEQRAAELEASVRAISMEQHHLRELVDIRFDAIVGDLKDVSSKLDTFMGKMEVLITRGQEAQGDLKASALGRQIDERLKDVESWKRVSQEFHAEVRGMTTAMRTIFGTSVVAFGAAVVAILKSIGVLWPR